MLLKLCKNCWLHFATLMIVHASHDAFGLERCQHINVSSPHLETSQPLQHRYVYKSIVCTAAKFAYEPKFITAAVQKRQFDRSNIDFIVCAMARLVDRQDKQQGKLPASGKVGQAHPRTSSVQTRQDSVATAASHVSQINAVKATASDPRPVASNSGEPLERGEDSEDRLGILCPCWPTPSVIVWDENQTIVTRAFLTSEWLLRQDSLRADASSHASSDAQRLMHAIAALIYKLVVGHLLDRELNMQRVFTSGLLPILEAWSFYPYGLTSMDLNALGLMLLTRMTTNIAVRSCDKALDASGKQREICAIQQLAKMFGESSARFVLFSSWQRCLVSSLSLLLNLCDTKHGMMY